MEHEAIIVRQRGRRVSLLDRNHGRSDAILSYHRYHNPMSPGTIISYREFFVKNGIRRLKIYQHVPFFFLKMGSLYNCRRLNLDIFCMCCLGKLALRVE